MGDERNLWSPTNIGSRQYISWDATLKTAPIANTACIWLSFKPNKPFFIRFSFVLNQIYICIDLARVGHTWSYPGRISLSRIGKPLEMIQHFVPCLTRRHPLFKTLQISIKSLAFKIVWINKFKFCEVDKSRGQLPLKVCKFYCVFLKYGTCVRNWKSQKAICQWEFFEKKKTFILLNSTGRN